MPTSHPPLELDAGRIFRWSFLAVFIFFEWAVWRRLGGGRRPRPLGHRIVIFLLAPWATRRAALGALILAGAFTVAGMLFVRLVVAPMLGRWLTPAFDPSSWMFHLSAGESPEASVPARFRVDGGWRPGALVLTGRRIWFLPSAWDREPWSIARDRLDRAEVEPSGFARSLPLRHWPDRLRLTDRSGDHASFAVADPDAVLSWFAPAREVDAGHRPRAVPQGAFDA